MPRLRKLEGDDCQDGRTCPAAYAIDDDEGLIIQGWDIHDPEILANLSVPSGQLAVRIPQSIVEVIRRHAQRKLEGDERQGGLARPARPDAYAIVDNDAGLIVQGWKIDDQEILAELTLPSGESAVRVPQSIVEVIRHHAHGT